MTLTAPPNAAPGHHLTNGTYAINLDVTDRPCLVVGAGSVATRKAAGLSEAAAAVTVVAPDICDAMTVLVDDTGGSDRPIAVHHRRYQRGEAASYRLVITATNDPAVNARVFADCEAAGVWCNSADDLDNCSFILPAIVRRGPLSVAVSSNGRSPAVASWLKRRLHDVIGPEVAELVEAVAVARSIIKERNGTTEAVDWAGSLDRHGGHLLDLAGKGRIDEVIAILVDDLEPVEAGPWPQDRNRYGVVAAGDR